MTSSRKLQGPPAAPPRLTATAAQGNTGAGVRRLDSVTHLLMGHALGAVAAAAGGAGARHAAAYWAAFTSSSVPDLDSVVQIWGGTPAYLKHHRTWTHSPLIGVPGSLAVAAACHRLWPGTPFWVVWAWSALAWALHVFIDLFNGYGTMVGWPWSRRRIAWDVLFIVDAPILGILLLPVLAQLAGVATDAAGVARAGGMALSAVAFYVALRTGIHARGLRFARAALSAAAGGDPRRVSVLPLPLGLRTWSFIVDDGGDYRLGMVDAFSGQVREGRRLRSDRHPAVDRSRSDAAVAAFLDFARYPLAQVEPGPAGPVVRWRDVRFLLRGRSAFEIVATPGERETDPRCRR